MISDKTFNVIKATIFGISKVFFFIKVEGKENIPQKGGYIICSNHRSNIDPLFLAQFLPQCPHFMAKEELFKVPVLGKLIKWGRAFPVKRGKSDISAVDNAIKIVENEHCLLMFPEGTRSKTGELLKPKSGVAFIASHSGGNVLPCAIIFKGKLFPFKKVTVRIGKIIENKDIKVDGKSASSLRAASKLIMDNISELLNK